MAVPALLAALVFCIPPVPGVALPGPVVRPFVAPRCARCAGHRGVTLAVPAGKTVRALVGGTVTFDGRVAGRRFVVMRAATGDLVTYGDLRGPAHPPGERILTGGPVGESGGFVYVGTRHGGRAVDPRLVIGSGAARLVPPPALSCPVGPVKASR